MKTISVLAAISLLGVSLLLAPTSRAEGTAFTYQGRLHSSGAPYTGSAEFRGTLWDAPTNGTQVATNTPGTTVVDVTDGLFTLPLDFGTNFPGADRWLQLEVRTDLGSFVPLNPRQALTPTPYALHARQVDAAGVVGNLPASQLSGTLPSGQLSGTYSGAVTFDNTGNTFKGDGSGLTGVNATTVGGVSGANIWKLNGNSGVGTGQFLGTTDNRPLELRVNGVPALRLESNSSGLPNVIGGVANTVAAGVHGASIGGGGTNAIASGADQSTIGGGVLNVIQINAQDATVGGGNRNTIENGAWGAIVGGGYLHTIQMNAQYATIGGGNVSTIGEDAYQSTIGGGFLNTIQSNAYQSVISGGAFNLIQPNAYQSTIGGGTTNTIQTGAWAATISGGWNNTIQTNAWAATIGGGRKNTVQTNAYYSTISGGVMNTIQDGAIQSTIGGGVMNTIQTNAFESTIGGGQNNTIQANATVSTIGGGVMNTIQTNAYYSTISGGVQNTIQDGAIQSTIGGGVQNTIGINAFASTISGGVVNMINSNASLSTIGGGAFNTIGARAHYATIPGGLWNQANGKYSFAAGHQAHANHDGAFVWADSQEADFSSTGTDQFAVRAQGGMRLDDSTSLFFGARVRQMLNLWSTSFGIGVQDANIYFRVGPNAGYAWYQGGQHQDGHFNSGGGTQLMRLESNGSLYTLGAVNPPSDRNLKENFRAVDAQEVLAKVATLPLTRWNYKASPGEEHLGPVAQDFYAAFGLGTDDKHIATVDADGVALAAIQGLNQKLEEIRAENEELKARLEQLERWLLVQTGGGAQ